MATTVPYFGYGAWQPDTGPEMCVFKCGRASCQRLMAITMGEAIEYRGTFHPCMHCMRAGRIPDTIGMSDSEAEEFMSTHDENKLRQLPLLRPA